MKQTKLDDCKNCLDIGDKSDLDSFLQTGELIIDEEQTEKRNDDYISSGKKVWEIICDKCHASWKYQEHWIPDNHGWQITRNGKDFDF